MRVCDAMKLLLSQIWFSVSIALRYDLLILGYIFPNSPNFLIYPRISHAIRMHEREAFFNLSKANPQAIIAFLDSLFSNKIDEKAICWNGSRTIQLHRSILQIFHRNERRTKWWKRITLRVVHSVVQTVNLHIHNQDPTDCATNGIPSCVLCRLRHWWRCSRLQRCPNHPQFM